ncbi:MAG: hypothetical protein US98_C0008G0010 [Parcubacteria group bacterium GW2011_GWC1_38_6]|nr:MAG: hypothetical protein US98_C0008G0010 [Parcubacteria group bacterium GW2011_GWC1_38_6]
MDTKEYQENIISLLANHEMALSDLYELYCDKSSEYRLFWLDISREEIIHARWIYQLEESIRKGFVHFNEERFKAELIQSNIDFIKKEMEKAQKEDISDMGALAMAYYLEDALLEKKFFEIFEGDSVEFKNVLKNLARATEEHRERIKETLKKERKKHGFPVE